MTLKVHFSREKYAHRFFSTNSHTAHICDEHIRFIMHQDISDIKAVTLEDIWRDTASDEFLSKLTE
jgi:hypothetical protein